MNRFTTSLFWMGMLACPLSAQISIPNFQSVAGPWECVDSNGIHGVFLSASALVRLRNPGTSEITGWQRETIFVSRRLQGGGTQGGSFIPNRNDATSMTSFDGKRLNMSFTNSKVPNLSPFEMDMTYDPLANRWVGSWSFCNRTGGAILERPHPREGVVSDVLVGDWEGGPNLSLGNGLLRFRESVDGKLIGWLNASISSRVRDLSGVEWNETEETMGRQVFVKSTAASKIIFEISDGVWFEGTLFAEGREIRGVWNNEGPGVGPVEGKRPVIAAVYRRKD